MFLELKKSFSQKYYSGNNLSGFDKAFTKMKDKDTWAIVTEHPDGDHIFVFTNGLIKFGL